MATRSIKKNYTFNLIARIMTLIVPLVVTPYISRVVGADGIGLCSYVSSVASYFVLVANLGIGSYALREISMHRDDENYIKKFAVEVTIMKAMLTLLCVAVYCGMFVRTNGAIDNYIYAIYATTIIEVIFDFSWYFQGIERFGILAIFNVLSKVFYVVLIFLFVTGADDLVIYALISILTGSMISVCGAFCMFKLCKGKIEGKLNCFKHFKPCMVYFLPAVASQIYTVVDKTMIGAITKSNVENGYYEFAERIARLPLTLLFSMNAIMESRTAYYYAQHDIEAAEALTVKSMNFSMMVAYPSTAGLIAIAKTFIPIYLGAGYEKCILLTYIFAPLISVILFSNLLGSHYYTPFGKRIKSAVFLVCGAVVNVILNSFMIYYFQSVGAAIASVVAETVISALYIIFARSFIKPIKFLVVSVKYAIAAAVMGVGVYFINASLPASVWYLMIEVAIGVAMYCLLLSILRTRYFLDTVKSLFMRVFRRNKNNGAPIATGSECVIMNEEVGKACPECDSVNASNVTDPSEEVISGFVVTSKRRAVWKKELELVEEFLRICEKHDIEYFIASGTLLGAVRHKGFIPWDDDIDIMMNRGNYEKFLVIAKAELKEGYFLQHYTTENNYFNGHIQLRDNNTAALLKDDYRGLKADKNCGIFIDIFPLDNVPNETAEFDRFTNKIRRKKRLVALKTFANYHGIKGVLKRLYFAAFARDTEKMIANIDKEAQKYNGKTGLVATTTFIPGYKKNVWSEELFKESVMLPFEHLFLNAPMNYDEVLRVEYDDYMTIPKDIPSTMHGSCYFDVEKSYREYVGLSRTEYDDLFNDLKL